MFPTLSVVRNNLTAFRLGSWLRQAAVQDCKAVLDFDSLPSISRDNYGAKRDIK